MHKYDILMGIVGLLMVTAVLGYHEAVLVFGVLALVGIYLLKRNAEISIPAIVEEIEREHVINAAQIVWQTSQWLRQGKVIRLVEGDKENPQLVEVGIESQNPTGKGKPVFHPEIEVYWDGANYVGRAADTIYTQ